MALRVNSGSLVYALDDAYIHMATAKHFALQGVWGVTSDGFTSATSSPAWTLLLVLVYAVLGVNDWSPFILNIFAATAALLLVYRAFQHQPAWLRLFVLFALLLCTPFVWLTFIGMEHLLHTLLVLALIFRLAPYLQTNASPHRFASVALHLTLAAGTTFVRYESVFVIAVLCAALVWRGRWRLALLVAFAAALPIVVYGIISLSHGWNFLPNSVLIKSEGAFYVEGDAFNYWLYSVFANLTRYPHLLMLVFIASGLLFLPNIQRPLLIVFILTTLLHVRFAGAGTHYRYEAYLVALGITVLSAEYRVLNTELKRAFSITSCSALSVSRWFKLLSFAALSLYAVLPLFRRALVTLQEVVPATQNIYQQQYQMAMFLREYYPNSTVVLNDIGTVSYYADIHLIDVIGLANIDVARARQTVTYTPERVAQITADADIAVVYDSWLRHNTPLTWQPVGSWQLVMNNIVLGGTTVTFYAADPAARDSLTANLLQYSSRLPANVTQGGDYTALLDLHAALDVLPADRAYIVNESLFGVLSALPGRDETDQAPAVAIVDPYYGAWEHAGYSLYAAPTVDFRNASSQLQIYLRQPETLSEIAAFGDDLRLRAWRLRKDDDGDDTSVSSCERVIIESWWQAARPITLDYSITLSLFGDAAGIVFSDRAPPIVTTQWQPQTLYADVRALHIPCEMPRNTYPLALGLHSADGQFLPVGAESFYVLTTLTVR